MVTFQRPDWNARVPLRMHTAMYRLRSKRFRGMLPNLMAVDEAALVQARWGWKIGRAGSFWCGLSVSGQLHLSVLECTIDMNSCRVIGFSRKQPSMRLVTMSVPWM